MIEKLDKHLAGNINSFNMSQNIMVAHKAIEKINELVDAVNELQKDYDNVCIWVGEQKLKTPADPYAEQHKWIGYLCWFWDDEYDIKTAGVLEEITTIEEEFHYAKKDNCTVWKHCEPVLPTDNAIYKGGDNE